MASQMREKQICNINDVTPKKKNWKVLIQVVQRKKGGISKDTNNPARYRGYLFIDTAGTLVSAVCHGTDVTYFETTLLPGRRYYVSDVHVRPVRTGYEVSAYPFSWTLYSTASVLPLEENVPPPLPYDFQFKKLSEMFRYAGREVPINVKGLVIGAFDEKKVGLDMYGRDLIAQDFVIVDDESIPMIMRLWKDKLNEYADVLSDGLPEPVFFVAMNVKVSTFNTLSLASRLNNVFLRDPLVREASALKEWYLLNKEYVHNFVSSKAYADTNRLLRKPSRADIIHIGVAMANLETAKTAWIAGRLTLMPGQEKFWYMACKNCHKSLGETHENDNPCPTCDASNPVRLMCHISVTITDASDTAYAEIYSPDAELLIPFTADSLKQAEEEGRSVMNELEAALENKHVVCYMKYFDKMIRGALTRKYPLTKIYMYDDVFPAAETPREPTIHPSSSAMMINEPAIDLTKDEEDNVQFFTPSTKVLIDQISASSQPAAGEVSAQSGCKRVLSFDNVPKATAVVKIEPLDDDVLQQPTLTGSSSAESPVKKSKGKLKQN